MTPYLVTIKANSSTFCTHFLPFKFVVKGLKVMYSFSKFIFVLCKCLGVAPVKLVNGQYVFSYVIFFYNVVFLTFQICIGLHALLSDYKSTFRGKSVRMKTRTAIVVTFLELFLSMIVIASGILGAAVNYKKILEIGSMLKRVDEELRTRWNFRKFTLLLCGILIHHVLLIYVDTYFWFSLTPDSWSYTVCYVYSFVEIAIEAQFALIAWSIKCRFQKINDSLAENLSYKYFTKFKRPFRLKQHLSFEMFQELHWSLCEAIQIVNNAFGWQLLTSVLCICVHIIVTPYFLLLDLFYPAAYGSADIGFLILQVAWIITHHMHLLLIVIPASETTVQAKKASIILSENLNCLVPATDILKLESFVLQLKAQSVKFSACGLFNLQRPVITSLIGSVVTYLVILIQFQNSDKVYH